MDSHNRFDRGMQESSTSSRASHLQKLMERETENIRQWKVENERRREEQQQEIQSKGNTIVRLQKQLRSLEMEKEEALTSLKENGDKCRELGGRLEKFGSKYQRIMTAVAQRDKEDKIMKELQKNHMEDKTRLKTELDGATENLAQLRRKLEELKVESVDRIALLRRDVGAKEEQNREISSELTATKEAQLLAVEKVSFLEQEVGRKTAALSHLQRDKDGLHLAHAADKERLQLEINEAEKSVLKLERDMADKGRELDEFSAKSRRDAEEASAKAQRELEQMATESERVAKELADKLLRAESEKGEAVERVRELEADIRRVGEELAASESARGIVEAEKRSLEADLSEAVERHRQSQSRVQELDADIRRVGEELAASESDRGIVEGEKRSLEADLSECRDRLAATTTALDDKSKGYDLLKTTAGQDREIIDGLRADLEREKADAAIVENDLRSREERVVALEDQVETLRAEAKKYQAEILFRHETLQQREAEYADLSRKLKEVLTEKEEFEAELSQSRRALATEKETREAEQKAKEAALREAEGLEAQISEALEQLDMSKEALDKAFADKSAFESDCVQLRMTNKSLERQLEASEVRCNALQDNEALLKSEADKWRAEQGRLSAAAEGVEAEAAKLKADWEKTAENRQSEKELYDKAIDELKAKHEAARKLAIDLENQLLDARKAGEAQAKNHEKVLEDIKKDREDLDKFNENNMIRCGNELKAANMKSTYELAAKDKELAAKDKELAAAKLRCDEAEAEREREKAAWEGTVEALNREIGDLKLNLRVKEAECEGRKDRSDQMEVGRNIIAAAVVATHTTDERPSGGAPTTIGEPAAPTAVESSSSLNSTQSAPILCTPKKSTQEPPFANSPSIKRRSVVSTSMNAHYKKPKVTFGGTTSRLISEDERSPKAPSVAAKDAAAADEGAEATRLPPKTPRTSTGLRPKRTLSTPVMRAEALRMSSSPAVGAIEPSGKSSTTMPDPVVPSTSGSSAPEIGKPGVSPSAISVSEPAGPSASSSSSCNVDRPLSKGAQKFAELQKKNAAKRDEKMKKREEEKAKYGNSFLALKAKNAERKKAKEDRKAEEAAKRAEGGSRKEDASSSDDGADWF